MFTLRTLRPDEFDQAASLIHASTNDWYQSHGLGTIFKGPPGDCRLFCDVYEDLDPGNCIVAEDDETGQLLGSCFFHPRETHSSLGIMNSHPDAAGKGVAGAILDRIIEMADEHGKPLRLVSSCLNLDSFSLYSRRGFAPFAVFQDVMVQVPETGFPSPPGVRPARPDDVPAIDALERRIWGTSRAKDWAYFIQNDCQIWRVSVAESPESGDLTGVLASVCHPASNMIGPGAAVDEATAEALIVTELNAYLGRSPVVLLPAQSRRLVSAIYKLGGRNCEMHLAQSRGEFPNIEGILMPTFMPETG
ncbi:MAG: GNAT superfamily N-acetyltransferase [Verrucomicrobiales bacterium]|jgi:GNAT superfamily N-acetyltransferase